MGCSKKEGFGLTGFVRVSLVPGSKTLCCKLKVGCTLQSLVVGIMNITSVSYNSYVALIRVLPKGSMQLYSIYMVLKGVAIPAL